MDVKYHSDLKFPKNRSFLTHFLTTLLFHFISIGIAGLCISFWLVGLTLIYVLSVELVILGRETNKGTLTNNSGLQVNKHSSGDMLSGPCLTKEGVESIISSTDGFVGGHLTVWLDAVLQTVELPAGIANLHPSLSNMDGDTLTLKEGEGMTADILW